MGLFKRKSRGEMLKLYVASDLHGSTACFTKLLQAPDWYDVDVLLVAGDLTGKMVVPIIEHGGAWTSQFHGQAHRFERADEVVEHEREIDAAGLYSYRTTPDEMADLEGDPGKVDEIFHRLIRERLERWLELGEERLAASGRHCFFVAGNDDYPDVDDVLRHGERMRYVEGAVARVNDAHEIVGLGVANVTPWHAPRDVPEDEIARRLDALAEQVEDPERAIFLVHVPPKDSTIDFAPQLDDELRPVGVGGGMVGVGSSAVRATIERVQPLLSVHGHIHESPGVARIGRTTCVNPGSEYSQSILRGALVNLTPDKVAGHLFVSG